MLLGRFFFSLSFIVGYETRIPGYELNSFLFLLVVCCELITNNYQQFRLFLSAMLVK